MSEFRNASGERRLLQWGGRAVVYEPDETVTVDDGDDPSFDQPGIWEKVGAEPQVTQQPEAAVAPPEQTETPQ